MILSLVMFAALLMFTAFFLSEGTVAKAYSAAFAG
jgi:hypothetical protein